MKEGYALWGNKRHAHKIAIKARKEASFMRIGVNLGPTGDWLAMLAAAQTADNSGFDTIGFLDHYHAPKLEWPYICGWSAYGALAMATSRIHLAPMEDIVDKLAVWEQMGVERMFITFWHPFDALERAVEWL